MCLVCLVSLPLLATHKEDLLYNIIRGAYSGTISESLLNNSSINMMKCDKAIPKVHAALYSLYALDWSTGSETCVPWTGSIPRLPFFYTPPHLSELKSCKSIISTDFPFIFIFK